MPKSTLSNPRGVRGAASLCAVAALAYLFVQDLLTIFVSALMGMRVQGASLSDPVGFSVAAQGLLGIVVAAGSIVLPLWWLLRATRLQTPDLRILLPAPWSPAFCLVVFLGLANAGNLFGGLLARGLGVTTSSTALPGGIGYSFSPKRSRPIPESVYCQITSSACPRFSPSHTYERLVVSSCPQLVSIACSRSVRSEKNNE